MKIDDYMPSTPSALEACPFCGPGESRISCYEDEFGYWTVGCGRCGSHSGKRPPSDPEGRTKVIDLWNSRPETDLAWKLRNELLEDRNRLLDLIDGGPLSSNEWQIRAIRAEAALARFSSNKPELKDLSFRESIRSEMIEAYLRRDG